MIDLARSQLLCSCISTRRIVVAIAVPARNVGRVKFRLLREGQRSERARCTETRWTAPGKKKRKDQGNATGNCEVVQRGEGLRLYRPGGRLCGRVRSLHGNSGQRIPHPGGEPEG